MTLQHFDPHSASAAELPFYERCLRLLRDAGVPYLVGGAYALRHHCGIVRDTKDLDLFLRERDLSTGLAVLAQDGFATQVCYPHWLAKAYSGDRFVDLIFSSGNGVAVVDDAWFEHASEDEMLGLPVLVCPAEETIWSKAFIQERERYDGADVAHLIAACGDRLDWDRLVRRFGDHWRVLYAHLVLFGFVYPALADHVPRRVMQDLSSRLAHEMANGIPAADSVCQGVLLSREQYLLDLAQGWRDARLEPEGPMCERDVKIWTEAIDGGAAKAGRRPEHTPRTKGG